jgi:hypothetical protein
MRERVGWVGGQAGHQAGKGKVRLGEIEGRDRGAERWKDRETDLTIKLQSKAL